MPPNTTHLCQPLDKGPFAPLKLEWRKSVQNFLSANPGRVVSRYDFSQLFHEAWLRAMNARNITAGFRHTGVFPFNKEAVLSQLRGGERHSDSHQERGEERHSDSHQERGEERHSDSRQERGGERHSDSRQERGEERHSDSRQERGEERHSDSRQERDDKRHSDSSQERGEERHQKRDSSEQKVKFMPSDDKALDPSDLDTSSCYLPPKSNIGRSYQMSKAVSTPKVTFKKSKPMQSSRILTSRENLILMEEKERQKREKMNRKHLKKGSKKKKSRRRKKKIKRKHLRKGSKKKK